MRVEHWSGGVLQAVEVSDLAAGTFTRYDAAGQVVEVRPLTAAEIAALTPRPDPRADLRAQIAAAESPAELQALLLQAIDEGVL